MGSNDQKGILDLPNEIYMQIYKQLPLNSMQSLAQTNKRFYATYENLNASYADKVSFNSKYDRIDEYKDNFKLKEVILNLYDITCTYKECIEFCFKRPHIEKIRIRGVTNDIFDHSDVIYASLRNLTHIEISILMHCDKPTDYVLPLVESSHALESIILDNVVLTREAMMEISLSKGLKCLKLSNALIFNIRAFHMLLTKMENIREFHYIFHHFIRIMPVTKTLEAIIEVMPQWQKLKSVKISAWQALSHERMQQTRFFKRMYHQYHLQKGNAMSFLSAVLPLLSIQGADNLEVYYLNHKVPTIADERASVQYTIVDPIEATTKAYRYGTI